MSYLGMYMLAADLKESLSILRISITEVSQLLGVNTRTVQRWLNSEVEIPKAIESVFSAWKLLNGFGLPWRPDGHSITLFDDHNLRQQIHLTNEHSIQLLEVLERVEKRGGAATPWHVDLTQKKATLGDVWVTFYILPNGLFSPQSYGRKDKSPDVVRDQAILEDAYVCIANAITEQIKIHREADWSSANY